jgi:hypothetical protein
MVYRFLLTHRQTSLMVMLPLAGEEFERLGSDSQVTAPLNLRMYLYSKEVLAGMFTVTMCPSVYGWEKKDKMAYRSK